MNIINSDFPDVYIIEPQIFRDDRGFFMETYQEKRYQNLKMFSRFVQDNVSCSTKNTLRGLHFQYPNSQAKLIQVLSGEIYDVVVDVRPNSATFGRWAGYYLSDKNFRQIYIPEGFAHGFCVLSNTALFSYKCSSYYSPKDECGILWEDPDINIQWPVRTPIISDKDKKLQRLKDIPTSCLP